MDYRYYWSNNIENDVFDRNCYNVDMLYIAWRKWRNRRFRGFGPSYTRYSQGPWTDFDAKYAKTRRSAQGCAYSGSRT